VDEVLIFGESDSPIEGFREFRQRNYTIILDGSVTDPWKTFVDCDVLLLSFRAFPRFSRERPRPCALLVTGTGPFPTGPIF